MRVTGLLLAAGAGRRYGRPKALVDDWLARSVAVLRDGGCDDVAVVLGAQAEAARGRVPAGVDVVVARDWATGMGASLRAGLTALGARTRNSGGHNPQLGGPEPATRGEAAVVHLVDLPDVTAAVVARLLDDVGAATLRRAAYGGRPGHPVVLGGAHWAGIAGSAQGDRGARDYLASHPHDVVECGDLAGGEDVDRPVP